MKIPIEMLLKNSAVALKRVWHLNEKEVIHLLTFCSAETAFVCTPRLWTVRPSTGSQNGPTTLCWKWLKNTWKGSTLAKQLRYNLVLTNIHSLTLYKSFLFINPNSLLIEATSRTWKDLELEDVTGYQSTGIGVTDWSGLDSTWPWSLFLAFRRFIVSFLVWFLGFCCYVYMECREVLLIDFINLHTFSRPNPR